MPNVRIRNGAIGDWGGWGIYSDTNADFFTIEDVVLELNGMGGVKLGPKCRAETVCVSECGGDGMVLGEAATVINCKVTDNVGTGIVAGSKSCVISTVVANNGGDGIFTDTNSTIRDCTAMGNVRNGVFCIASCRVLDCNIGDNGKSPPGAAGISLNGPGHQIKGNNVTANQIGIFASPMTVGIWIENNSIIDNGIGLQIHGMANFVVRNCIGTPVVTNGVHASVAPNNHSAKVLNDLGISFTNSNPWANIRLTPE